MSTAKLHGTHCDDECNTRFGATEEHQQSAQKQMDSLTETIQTGLAEMEIQTRHARLYRSGIRYKPDTPGARERFDRAIADAYKRRDKR